MKKILLLLFIFTTCYTFANNDDQRINNFFSNIDPVPEAENINRQTTIIFTPASELIDETVFASNSIKITGNIDNIYKYAVTKSPGSNTYIIKTLKYFVPGEKITVNFTSKIKYKNFKKIDPFNYSFTVCPVEIPGNSMRGFVNEIPDNLLKGLNENYLSDGTESFPVINVSYSNNPAQGSLLLSNIVFNSQIPNTPYLLILKNDGTPVFSREMAAQIFNFDRQPNGNFTYFNRAGGKYYEMDTAYHIIDSFYTGNGYLTDIHELRVLPNRHALLMSYDKLPVDMSHIIQGGNPNALVTGLILQEIDENKNVVFQWRSWDHMLITDATHEDMFAAEIDYVHGNAIELDNDGNILLSSRHLDEITKINRSTGEIIWRLGGKHNQFAFNNDPLRFSYQHAIRRLQNGHIILFDNGNYHTPQYSRAVEYMLDENNMTATMIWEYRHTPVLYGYAMGFAQRLGNGNTLISWGATNPTLTEVKPDGTKTLELTLSAGCFYLQGF